MNRQLLLASIFWAKTMAVALPALEDWYDPLWERQPIIANPDPDVFWADPSISYFEQRVTTKTDSTHTRGYPLAFKLGYRTLQWRGWSALLEVGGTLDLGNRYDDPDTDNADLYLSKPAHQAVDIPTSQLQIYRLLLRYDSESAHSMFGHQFRLGRQTISSGVGRFLTDDAFRHHGQQFDGGRYTLQGGPWTVHTGYLFGATRSITDNTPEADLKMNAGFFEGTYDSKIAGHFSALAFYHDINDTGDIDFYNGLPIDTESTAKTGDNLDLFTARLSLDGDFFIGENERWRIPYLVSLAWQTTVADHPDDFDDWASYLSLGVRHECPDTYLALELTASHESLAGDGTTAVQTPFGNNLRFQGLSSPYQATPKEGLTTWTLGFDAEWAPAQGHLFGGHFAHRDFADQDSKDEQGHSQEVLLYYHWLGLGRGQRHNQIQAQVGYGRFAGRSRSSIDTMGTFLVRFGFIHAMW